MQLKSKTVVTLSILLKKKKKNLPEIRLGLVLLRKGKKEKPKQTKSP